MILVAMLTGGAPWAAYEIFATARDAVLALGQPDLGSLPNANLQVQRVTPVPPNVVAGERVNILVLGIDRRPTEKCPCRTDAMMLASLDPKTSTAGLVTIPRDLYVPIPGVGDNRINEAMFYGALYRYPGGGPALAKQTVEYNLGRRVHFYALLDFGGFRKIIDTVGGIDIDVPNAIDDAEYPTEDFRTMRIHFNKGLQHMDGERALEYVRTRHQDADFGRSRRQIQVMLAARDKALKLDWLPKLPLLIQQLWGSIETDLTPQDVLALAPVAAKVRTENIKTASIDQTMTVDFRTSGGAEVLWPDRAKIGRLLDAVIPRENGGTKIGDAIQREAARILILNGTSTPALGERTARFLQAQGFQITAFGNADRADYAKSVLIDYNREKNSTVALLASIFHMDIQNIRYIDDVKSDVEIRLILGADWSPPP